MNSFFIFVFLFFLFVILWISEYINSLVLEMIYGFVILIVNIVYYILVKEFVKVNKGYEKVLKVMLNDYKKLYLLIGLNVLGIVLGYLVVLVVVLIVNIVILVVWIIFSCIIEL